MAYVFTSPLSLSRRAVISVDEEHCLNPELSTNRRVKETNSNYGCWDANNYEEPNLSFSQFSTKLGSLNSLLTAVTFNQDKPGHSLDMSGIEGVIMNKITLQLKLKEYLQRQIQSIITKSMTHGTSDPKWALQPQKDRTRAADMGRWREEDAYLVLKHL